MDKLSEVHKLLYRLGVTPNYMGFDLTAHAVLLCKDQPNRLHLVTKLLYPDVAKLCGTTSGAVERNIRTASRIAWQRNRALLEALAQGALEQPPQNTLFLSFLYAGISSVPTLPPHGLGEAVALAGEDYDVGVVNQAVDEGSGEPVIPKDGIPLAELQV